MKIKFKSSLLVVAGTLLPFTIQLNAAPVSLQDAQNVALNWMAQTTGKHFGIAAEFGQNTIADSNPVLHATTYRIIFLKPKGWVIVASDDIAEPVIAYGESAINTSSIPPEFSYWMSGIDKEIKEGIKKSATKKLGANQSAIQERLSLKWEKLKRDPAVFNEKLNNSNKNKLGTVYTVKPLLWMGGNNEDSGILWNQNKYYNQKCPTDWGGNNDDLKGHVYAGCVATAMGQMMKYYSKPTQGTGSHSYTDANYGFQSANFATTYNWSTMPYKLTDTSSATEIDAIATLLYHAGVSVEMVYGTNGSYSAYHDPNGGAAADSALQKYFGFADAVWKDKANNSGTWDSLIRESLDEKNPVLYAGIDAVKGGHAFVLDGYTNDGFYHFNWGWSGEANGNFRLSSLTPKIFNFAISQQAIFPKYLSNGGGSGSALGYLLPLFGLFVFYRRRRYAA